jgi:hypothetical protein
MIISKSKKFIYIHLDKCGGTSIETALEPFLSWDDIIIGSTPFGEKLELVYQEKKINNIILTKHSSANEIKNFIGNDWNNFYKFTTVRDPKSIMISLYYYVKDMVDYHIDSRSLKDITSVFFDESIKKEILFLNNKIITSDTYFFDFIQSAINKTYIDGFISTVISKKYNSIETQISRIDNSVEIFNIDDIKNNWSNILNKINIVDTPLPFLNKSNKPKNIILKKETINLIKTHFYLDYEQIPKLINCNWD